MARVITWKDGLSVLHVGGLKIEQGDIIPEGVFSDEQIEKFRSSGKIVVDDPQKVAAPAVPQPDKGNAK